MKLNINDCEDLDVEGIDKNDCPDFADAYFSSGYNVVEDRNLTEEELDYLTDTYPDVMADKIQWILW